MLELARTEAALTTCLAAAEALDAVHVPRTVAACRVAADELLLIGAPGSVTRAASAAAKALRELDEDALVMDVTDGWTVWTLSGADARGAFERLSMLELPASGVVQGDVARLPAKAVAERGRVHLAVPSSWAAYLHERIVELPLPVAEDGEPHAWGRPRGSER